MRIHPKAKHKTEAKMKKEQKALVAKNGKNVTLEKNTGKKEMKPYCEASKVLAEQKRKVEELKPAAVEWLKAKLNSDPETKDFTGTVLCVYDGIVYKVRVQRPDNTDWKKKYPKDDPRHKELLACYKQQEDLKAHISDLEGKLAEAHPKCVENGFVVSFLSK